MKIKDTNIFNTVGFCIQEKPMVKSIIYLLFSYQTGILCDIPGLEWHFAKRNIFTGKVAWNSYLTHGLRKWISHTAKNRNCAVSLVRKENLTSPDIGTGLSQKWEFYIRLYITKLQQQNYNNLLKLSPFYVLLIAFLKVTDRYTTIRWKKHI
jgi:hypothetical protein